jgi:spore germination protein KC
MGKRLYFSNNKVCILSDSICKDDLDSLFDFFERSEQFRPDADVYLAQGDAGKILNTQVGGTTISGRDISLISENYYNSSKTISVKFSDIYENLSNGITDIILPVISVQESPLGVTSGSESSSSSQSSGSGGSSSSQSSSSSGGQILTMSGSAVFNKNKLAGYLDDTETRGYLFIMGQAKSGILTIDNPEGGKTSLEIIDNKSKFTVFKDKKGKIGIKVAITVQSNITEDMSKNKYMDVKFKKDAIKLL